MNPPSPISQVGPWRTYVTAKTLTVKVNMVLFLRGRRNNKFFFEDLFIRLRISKLSEK